MDKDQLTHHSLKSILDSQKHALELLRHNARSQQVAVITAIAVGVVAGVGIALWMLNRSKPTTDADESGNPLFV
ncbi:MAG: hypothetical protein U0Z75_06115 [Deinococcaceae bacterium]